MKSSSATILRTIEKAKDGFSPILLYGNEGGLISELIKSIYSILQKKIDLGEIQYFDHKSDKGNELGNVLMSASLFSKVNFVVIKHPQKKIITELETLKNSDNIILVNGEGLQARSEIKTFFENHHKFIGVPCYQLSREQIKKIIDEFLNDHKIVLEKTAYWFLVENINEDYLSLRNELQKLVRFEKKQANLVDIQTLIVPKHNTSVDNYFFNCASGSPETLLQKIGSESKSINETYEILISIKRFIQIFSSAMVSKNTAGLDMAVKKHLPKYLFLKKNMFREMLSKNDIKQIIKINKMLQKTELLIRTNSEQHKEILERFLLNLAITIK